MYKTVQHHLTQSWLPLLVNGSGMVLCGRAGWMIMAAPLTEGWVLFTNSAVLRDIVLFTGKSGLLFLVLSLACTPLARLLGWTPALQVRKALGLWGFGFACLHSLFFLQGKPLFVGWNSGAELGQAFQSMVGIVLYGSKVPYAEAGVYALLLLLPLALTSNRLAMRRLGKNWKRLHRLVYLAVPVVVYHYWWRTVTDFPVPAPPAYWQPILFAVAVGLLLLVRIPPVRRWVAARLGMRLPDRRLQRNARRPTAQALVPLLDITPATPQEQIRSTGSLHHLYTNGATPHAQEKQEPVVEQV